MAISAEIADTCVRPGGTQTITITAPPASGVGYNTYYADGKSGLSEGFYGGNRGGFTDDDSTWSDTWTIAPNAPAGKTVVVVLATHPYEGRGETGIWFYVADLTGSCPD